MPELVEADFKTVGPNEWLLAQVRYLNAALTLSAEAVNEQMERTLWFQQQPVTFVRMTFHQGYRMSTQY